MAFVPRTFRQCCRKVRKTNENVLNSVCFTLVTTLSRPLLRLSRTNIPATNARCRPVSGHGRLSAHTLKAAQRDFLRGKQGFSGAALSRPVSLNSDSPICGTAGALLLKPAKALIPKFRRLSRNGFAESANPFRAFYGITGSSEFCAVPAASVRFSVDSLRFRAF